MTGSIERRSLASDDRIIRPVLTGVIPSNRRFHNRLHPIPYNRLIIRAKVMRLVRLVLDSESILPRVHSFIHSYFIPRDIDVAFNFSFLLPHCQSTCLERKSRYSPPCCCSSANTGEDRSRRNIASATCYTCLPFCASTQSGRAPRSAPGYSGPA